MLANESYLQKRKPTFKNAKTLLVPVTSDKGLCGALNSNIVREVRTSVRENRAGYKLFLIGEKAYSAMVRPYPDLLT
jgi:F0F1-type ATP synthase gamma subunit